MKDHALQLWLDFFGIELIDADGWIDHELTELIDVVTFAERISISTIRVIDKERYKLLTFLS